VPALLFARENANLLLPPFDLLLCEKREPAGKLEFAVGHLESIG
jgi:hypothetical protein